MPLSVVEWTGDQITEAARQASRATSAVVDALEEGLGATDAAAKLGGDTAEELMEDTIQRLTRHPVETVVATFAIGVVSGVAIGIGTGLLVALTLKRK